MKKLRNTAFILVNFIVTRMVPFGFLSPLMNVLTLFMFGGVLYERGKVSGKKKILFLNIFILIIALVFSILVLQNLPLNAVRSYLLLIIVLSAYFIRVNETALRWFLYLNIFQSFVIICISLFMAYNYDIKSYLPMRFYYQEMGWGDLYTYNGWFYIVQIKGNALIVFALMLLLSPLGDSICIKYRKISVLLLLLGMFIAGNFAYLISLSIFCLFWYLRSNVIKANVKLILLVIIVGIIFFPLLEYVQDTLTKKESSLGTRTDQIIILFESMTDSVFSFLIGTGMGHTLDVVTAVRDYRDDVYYELQILYVMNQLGIILFFFYMLSHVLLGYINYHKEFWAILLYFCYVLYALSNPYILDTNQFIVVVVLNSVIKLKESVRLNSKYTFQNT